MLLLNLFTPFTVSLVGYGKILKILKKIFNSLKILRNYTTSFGGVSGHN